MTNKTPIEIAIEVVERARDRCRSMSGTIAYSEALAALQQLSPQDEPLPEKQRSRALSWASKAGATSPEEAAKIKESYDKLKQESFSPQASGESHAHPASTSIRAAPQDAVEGGLIRYGLNWKGHDYAVCEPMPDGYWTPWHLAQEAITRAEKNSDKCNKSYDSGYLASSSDV